MQKIDYFVPNDYGLMLGKTSERMVLSKGGKTLKEMPLMFLRSITVGQKGAAISSDLIQKCCEYGIQINFINHRNDAYAKLTAPQLSATVEIVKGQYESLLNGNGLKLTHQLVSQKVRNQKRLLKYFNKYQENPDIDAYITKMDSCLHSLKNLNLTTLEENHPSLLGLEGSAGSFYWQAVKVMIQDKTTFSGRKTRGAKDLVNSMLNYAYAILYSRVWGMIMLAGMEPFLGYLHKDKSGKPSLVLDIMELYRIIADHTVLTYINNAKKELPEEMTDTIKKEIADKILEKLAAHHQLKDKKFPFESIMQKNIRNISMFLRNKADLDLYTYPLR